MGSSDHQGLRQGAAEWTVFPSVAPEQPHYLNNCAEQAHQLLRQRAGTMRQCTSAGHTQRCLVAYGPLAAHVRPRYHGRRASRHLALVTQ